MLTRMARAVERNDVPVEVVRRSVRRLIEDKGFTVRDAYNRGERSKSIVLLSRKRLIGSVLTRKELSGATLTTLRELRDALNDLLEG